MRIQKQKLTSILTFFAFSVMVSLNAYAEEGAIRFSNNAYKQIITKSAGGEVKYDYVEPGLVLPEDVILYEIVFENISKQDVANIVINNPIANNSNYRGGSAVGDAAVITYSVDGESFSAADTLTIKDKTGKSWQAKPEDYTAIRWVYKKVLKPGEKSKVTYKTTIK